MSENDILFIGGVWDGKIQTINSPQNYFEVLADSHIAFFGPVNYHKYKLLGFNFPPHHKYLYVHINEALEDSSDQRIFLYVLDKLILSYRELHGRNTSNTSDGSSG